MAKCLSAVFRSAWPPSPGIVAPSRLRVWSSCQYSAGTENRLVADGDHRDNEVDAADRCRQRLLKIAIVGVPNAGKSSLINSIVKRNICAYSKKVHTTRCSARAVQCVDDTQLVFLDTPGLVDSKEISKFNLDTTFANDSVNAIDEADIIGVIHDVSNRFTRGRLDPKVSRLLHLYPNKESFLVLNKIDLLKSKSYLLELARSLTCYKHERFHVPEPYVMTSQEKRAYEIKGQERMLEKKVKQVVGWDKFNEVFMVSAIQNQGSSDIKEYLLQKSKPSPWIFSKDKISDREDHELVINIIDSKLYDDLPNEVPYNLKLEIEYFEVSREGNVHIVVLIHCNTPRIEKLVMGRNGRRIRSIAKNAEQSLRNMFLTDVFLKLVVCDKLKSSSNSDTNI